jgi:5-methyltetrahydrofolate corrinoid/iron sulfur protein methyltransferase
VIIVGERLNSSRSSVLAALSRRDEEFLVGQARAQEQAGARFIDLNCAALLENEAEALEWAVPLLQSNIKVPLSIDSPNTEAMGRALRVHQGRALLNSLSGEEARLRALLPLIKEHRPRVIVLCLDDEGLRREAEAVFDLAARLSERLIREGVDPDDLFLDPLVHPVGVAAEAPGVFLRALGLIKKRLPGLKTIAGLSNVSFGLPDRKLVNRTFLTLALAEGLDAAILDPLDPDLADSLVTAEALLGRDPSLKAYLRHARARKAGLARNRTGPDTSEP